MTQYLLQIEPLTAEQRHFVMNAGFDVLPLNQVSQTNLADIVISYGWDAEIGSQLLALPEVHLRWVQAKSAGVDYLPLADFDRLNIILTNASGLKALPIAQSVIGYILHFARGLNHYQTLHSWAEYEDQYTIPELPALIFGTGSIGQQIARYIKDLGGTAYGVNTRGTTVDGFDNVFATDALTEIPSEVKIIINVLPGTSATDHFFDQSKFEALRDIFLFINIGRGSTVDEAALIAALDAQHIRYAALDVTELEPLPADSPLWQHQNILLTQHTTWVESSTPGRAGNLFRVFEPNLTAFVQNAPFQANVVNLDKGY
jgi:phosphoglycerate dehydrogenase-like enzyme